VIRLDTLGGSPLAVAFHSVAWTIFEKAGREGRENIDQVQRQETCCYRIINSAELSIASIASRLQLAPPMPQI
jgi:hypothetical protein